MKNRLLIDDTYHSVLQYCFRYLAGRARSEQEIRKKLQMADISSDMIELVIQRLKELKYVDDRQFAADWIKSRIALRPRGRLLLKNELLLKGLEETLVDEILGEEFPQEIEFNLCLSMARKKALTVTNVGPEKKRTKIIKYLQSKGFTWDCIREVQEHDLN